MFVYWEKFGFDYYGIYVCLFLLRCLVIVLVILLWMYSGVVSVVLIFLLCVMCGVVSWVSVVVVGRMLCISLMFVVIRCLCKIG